MNIAVDIRPLIQKQRTGVGEYTYQLLDALFRIDTENQYFLFYNSFKDVSDVLPVWKQKNVYIIATKWPNKILNALLLVGFVKLDKLIIKKVRQTFTNHNAIKQLDIFFSPNIHFISLSKKIKHILTIHDLSFYLYKQTYSWKRRLWHRCLRPKKQCILADNIITPSKHTRQDLIDKWQISNKKIAVLYPGVSDVFVQKEYTKEQKEALRKKYNLPQTYLLFLGTLEPRKNVRSLIDAFQTGRFAGKGYTLVIAGAAGWKDANIHQAIINTQGVQYIGYVDVVDKPLLYQLARVFVYPSVYEGFGIPVLESFVSGTPVVTSNRSSLPEVSDDAAYLINPDNSYDIVLALQRLLSNKDLCGTLKEKGFQRAGVFSWEKSAEDFHNILHKL
jgi:glycosyltransferase involved in cell wall biosynthesis